MLAWGLGWGSVSSICLAPLCRPLRHSLGPLPLTSPTARLAPPLALDRATRLAKVSPMQLPSFWFSQLPPPPPRPPLRGATDADVAIVGAGFTGLWAAYYLKRAQPDLKVVVLEARFAGFGASGRNGGWLTGAMAWNPTRLAATHGESATRAFIAALQGSVGEVIGRARAEGIDADVHETEELTVATHLAALARLSEECRARASWGEAVHMIDANALAERVRIPGAKGALVLSGVARVQPAKLVLGLARCVERLGVPIYENTSARQIAPGRVETERGVVKARSILRCTEGFTAQLRGARRQLLPLNSAQIVTRPLPQALWARIGWQGEELLGTADRLYAYCQRTADGRIAVGGRGLPYRFASRIDDNGTPDPVTLRRLQRMLARLFPDAAFGIDHAWCGVLGVSRDWVPNVAYDPATGLGWAGGYVGVGVATANLAGRTLADLVLQRKTPLTALPWVNRRAPHWEVEPFRWLAVRGMYALYRLADWIETKTERPSPLGALADWLTGR